MTGENFELCLASYPPASNFTFILFLILQTKSRSVSRSPAEPVANGDRETAVKTLKKAATPAANGTVPPPSPGQGKQRAQPATNDVGLVSNESLQEGELDGFCAPEDALAEETRLREEREAAQEAKDAARREKAEAVLEANKFEQLERLLNQSQMFTQFLSEQMTAAEERAVKDTEEALAEGSAKGGKRKSTSRGKATPKTKKHRGDAPPEVTAELCPGFTGSLRDYQLKGVKWMISLYQNGLNGILADQMGLGKTVQTIAFLCHMRSKGIYGPFMVLGPLSTLPNWTSEFQRWAPDFPVVLYHGSKDERADIRASRMSTKIAPDVFPVVVTSYEIAIADIKFLAKHHWKYVVVDEGHRLKNMNCKLIRELKTLRTDNKLLLTGTPLQNNLTELWSLLNFLLPEVFSSLENFESWFDFAANVGQEGAEKEIAAQEQRSKVISKLHAILKPFLLRRIKSDVETSLPGKMEIILYAHMSEKQQEINQQLADKTLLDEMAKNKARGGGGASMASLNNMLMQMRKNCNHPDLITAPFEGSICFPPADQLVAECGKMALLDRLLSRLLAADHKVLIFSQMTAMLDIMDAYFEEKGILAMRIDGSVSWQERQERMRRFNTEPDAKIFLLSTRAGGLGINLTAADTCIIYDSDWNPHQDLQAMDRCHRIGQTKPVLVLRLATAQSVEGKMLRRANSKLMLERLVIKKGAFLDVDTKKSSMSAEELFDVLKADVSKDDVPQSAEVDDTMLERILDRAHLAHGKTLPYSESGPGYEVVAQLEGSGLLQGVE
jgi:ATP-dependent DNA helicase